MKRQQSHPDYDKQLMFKAAGADRQAFAEIYKEFQSSVRAYLASQNNRQISLDDLVQEVFTRAWQQRERFAGRSSVRTYLFGIAANVLREQQNTSEAVTRFSRLDHLDLSVDAETYLYQAETQLHRNELIQAVEQAKSKLSARQRQAIDMIYYQDLSGTEAAKFIGCSCEALRNRLYQAKKHLRELLNNWNLSSQTHNQPLQHKNPLPRKYCSNNRLEKSPKKSLKKHLTKWPFFSLTI